MEPVGTHIVVLNYNGRELLAECLPSIALAAARAPAPCPVTVLDNGSTDGSLAYLAESWPAVQVVREPNAGLASFNTLLGRLTERTVFLLNNDVKLAPDAIGPLVADLYANPDALFAAPLCWDFDGESCEGMRTKVGLRFGLVRGLCRFPGHEAGLGTPDLTASAGPVLAVDRLKFLALGGYDRIYFPGRIEDLDLGFRGWMAGWTGRYVPSSVAYHRGFGSFGPAFGAGGCDRLALRNSLLFSWKNLGRKRLAGHLAWLSVRLAYATARGQTAPWSALFGALRRLPAAVRGRKALGVGKADWSAREDAFFDRFDWTKDAPAAHAARTSAA
jgi:N-acetylglucosaminyl-diphospho-decaprenol L-rhamnosyltransferase